MPQSAVGAEAEKAGMPAVSIVAPQFAALSSTAARAQGIPDLAITIIPFNVMNGERKEAEGVYQQATADVVHGFTKWTPPPAKVNKGKKQSLKFQGDNYQVAVDRMNQYFLSHMWSDGMPLVPPTRERVEWLLSGTDVPRTHILTDKFPPRKGIITVENVAINAAMAGARPEYMPIIVGAVEAFATEAGLTLMHFLTNSVVNQAPVIIVNGPIAKEIDVNASYGIMGPGWQANATIGRAISLLFINGAGAFFGPGGNLPCQSIPGRYSWCFAENEERSPWKSLRAEAGLPDDASSVTVALGKGTHLIFLQPPVEHILNMISHAVEGISAREFGVPWDQLLVLCPDHARILAGAGMTKQDIQKYVFEHARIPLSKGEATGFIFRHSPEWAKRVEGISDKEHTLIPKLAHAENLKIVVAGGENCVSSTLIPGQFSLVTKSVEKFKPARWIQLLERAKADKAQA